MLGSKENSHPSFFFFHYKYSYSNIRNNQYTILQNYLHYTVHTSYYWSKSWWKKVPNCIKTQKQIWETCYMLWEPFKVTVPSCMAVGYVEKNCQRCTQICQLPFIYYIQLLATALWTNLESVCNSAINILSPECCYFCIGNGAMNAQRYWQRHNEPSLMLATAQRTLLHIGNDAIRTSTILATVLWTLRNVACSDVGTSGALQRE
jgi:hypothetical protein